MALYHLGNNALHAAIYRRALERPGVVVLHDAVLHHFLLGQLDEAAYIEEFVYNYGEWNRALARELWRGRAASGCRQPLFRLPHAAARGGARAAPWWCTIRPAARSGPRATRPRARVVEIPHLFRAARAAPGEAEVLRFRERLGVPRARSCSAFSATCGNPSGCIAGAGGLRRACGARSRGPRCWWPAISSPRDLERAAAPLLIGARHPPPAVPAGREFWLAARAVDACINLRYPAPGETSGIAIRLMGIGKPVLVTDSPECAALPRGRLRPHAAGPRRAPNRSARAHRFANIDV